MNTNTGTVAEHNHIPHNFLNPKVSTFFFQQWAAPSLQRCHAAQSKHQIKDANLLPLNTCGWILELATDQSDDTRHSSGRVSRSKELVKSRK